MSTEAMTEIERINVLLPTELFAGSKDWRVGSIADRVDWLLTMYSSAKEEVERLQSALEAQPQQEPVATLFGSLPVYDTSPPAQPHDPVGYLYQGISHHTQGKKQFSEKQVITLEGRWWQLVGPVYTSPPAQEIVCSTGLCHYRKPQQEPVAWLQIGLAPFHQGDVIARTTKPTEWNRKWWRFEPLYTSPPARKPLTDEEIGSCIDEVNLTSQYGHHHFGWHKQFARAIEAAHGITGEQK